MVYIEFFTQEELSELKICLLPSNRLAYGEPGGVRVEPQYLGILFRMELSNIFTTMESIVQFCGSFHSFHFTLVSSSITFYLFSSESSASIPGCIATQTCIVIMSDNFEWIFVVRRISVCTALSAYIHATESVYSHFAHLPSIIAHDAGRSMGRS